MACYYHAVQRGFRDEVMMQLSKSCARILIGASLFLLMADRQVFAQSAPVGSGAFVAVNIGAQPKARDYTVSQTFPIYDETASVQTLIGTGGKPIFDFGGGYRVWHGLSLGVAFSFYKDSSSTTAMASIPDPLFFDSPHSSSFPLDVLDHSERAVHLSFIYSLPFTLIDKLDIAVFAGPSFFTLKKDLPGAVTVVPGGSTLSDVAIDKFSGSATSGHVGVDVTYMFMSHFGAGGFLRYGAASVDVPDVEGGKVDVGGLNLGVGGRIRF